MVEAIRFGSREAANMARDAFDIEGDRRFKAVDLSAADIEAEELTMMQGMAAESRLEQQASAGQATLTEAERARLDFSRTDVFSAAAAKASMRRQGIDDWMAHFDPDLIHDENVGLADFEAQRGLSVKMEEMGRAATVGRRAHRDDEVHAFGESRELDERWAHAYHQSQSGLEEHAMKHARQGDPEAKAELRRMGWSESEIREIVATGQVKAALTPGQAVRLSNGMKVSPRDYARAKRAHQERSARAQQVDGRLRAPVTTDYERWRSDPSHHDFPGVDTVRPLRGYFDDEGRYAAFRAAIPNGGGTP